MSEDKETITEGGEGVVQNLDLDKYNIKNIRYEKWGFPTESFTKYNTGDNLNNYGIEGTKLVEQKLLKYNYNAKISKGTSGMGQFCNRILI